MFKKFQSVIVFSLLFCLICCTTVRANPDLEKEAAKVKTEIAKLGTGTEARIKIKLRNNTKLKGYVSEVKDSGFVVVDEKTGTETEISYSQVKQVKQVKENNYKIVVGILKGILIFGLLGILGGGLSSDY